MEASLRDGGGFSLLAAAEEFDKEEAELAIAQHTALLRRRFALDAEQEVLETGLSSIAAMRHARTLELTRLQQLESVHALREESLRHVQRHASRRPRWKR